LHSHCYTVEALLYAYACQQDPRFLERAEKGVEWMVRVQHRSGYLPRWHGNGWFKGRASDAQAQAIRLLSLCNMLRPRETLEEAARKALVSLLSMQSSGEDPRERGGFFEGDVRRYRFVPRKSRRMFSWAAMFAIHALNLEKRMSNGEFFVDGKYLF
jgi:uncharacterized protein YyaL (SSP411 family)